MGKLQEGLVRDSLQSVDSLLRVASNFAIAEKDILKDRGETEKAFNIRNQIIHEMDADLRGQKSIKDRNQRTEKTMYKYSEIILKIGNNFINSVYKKIHTT
jgi:hypothetical protein